MPRLRPLTAIAVMAAMGAALAGCASDAEGDTGIRIVASTSVYGDLAATIGGDLVSVDSIIDDPAKDPHEYQADARTQLALSKADLVVRNGGGYDDFVDTMLTASGNDSVPVVDAVELSSFDPAAPDFNEHVWYDYPTVGKVVAAIEARLAALDPAHAELFSANADQLQKGVTALEDQVAAISGHAAGTGVAITEPVPLHLLQNLGLDNRTPAEFSEAVENDTDVAPSLLRETLALFTDGKVALLVFNPQTGGPQTDAVLAAAKKSGVPAVAADEILPPGYHYLEWQSGLLDDIAGALGV